MAFLTLDFARSHDVPPKRSSGGREAPVYFWDEVQPLDGNEQLVLAGVAQFQKFLNRIAGHTDLLEAHEHPDAVIDVHHQVARLQIAEVR